MAVKEFSPWLNLRYDFPAAVVVFLVALPLCLGIALASGAPLFSGIIAGIVGGVVVGTISKSSLSISGPAAGLTVIVYSALEKLPSFEAFLLAVCLAGVMQMAFSLLRAGVIGDFIPSAVIKGMLAAIGIILILKQLPHAIGYDADFEGNQTLLPGDTSFFAQLWLHIQQTMIPGAALISIPSLMFLAWWDKVQPKLKSAMRYIPGPLVVVAFGLIANQLFMLHAPELAIAAEHLVAVPVSSSITEFFGELRFPDFGQLNNPAIWMMALTLAIVASLETLLSIEAIDRIDPYKRVTPTNHELLAQGVGNVASGLIGGLPVTSVIVRSSANLAAGGRTKAAAIIHGMMLLVSVLAIPALLNMIPLAALAAILISVGYKLAKPQIFIKKYEMGIHQFVPFVVTVVAIIATDLLIGIGIGVAVGVVFVLLQSYRSSLLYVTDGDHCMVRLKKDFFFLHKYELKQTLSKIPEGIHLVLDISRVSYIDPDNVEIIQDFITNAKYRNIKVTIKSNPERNIAPSLQQTAELAA